MRRLRLHTAKITSAGSTTLNLPAAGAFYDTASFESLCIVAIAGAGTGRDITIELADPAGTVFATITPTALAASSTNGFMFGRGNVTQGTFIAYPIEVPAKMRVNLTNAKTSSVDITVFGRGED